VDPRAAVDVSEKKKSSNPARNFRNEFRREFEKKMVLC
jgi:hypothetical protein